MILLHLMLLVVMALMPLFLLRKRERDEGESERESVILLLLLLPLLMSLQSPMKTARDVEAPTVLAKDLLKGLVLLAIALLTF